MGTSKNKTTIHTLFFLAAVLFAVFFLLPIGDELSDAALTLVLVTSTVTVVLGYFRPFLRRRIRWVMLAWMLYVCASACGSDDLIGKAWGGMNICLFATSITLRRMAMALAGDTRVAVNSTLRKIYSFADEIYVKAAQKMDSAFHCEGADKMVPLGHTMAMLAFGILMLITFMEPYAKMDVEMVYCMYGGFMILALIIYTIGTTCRHGKLGYNLLTALVMTFVGITTSVVSLLFAVLSFMVVGSVLNAISNLLKKLFGDD